MRSSTAARLCHVLVMAGLAGNMTKKMGWCSNKVVLRFVGSYGPGFAQYICQYAQSSGYAWGLPLIKAGCDRISIGELSWACWAPMVPATLRAESLTIDAAVWIVVLFEFRRITRFESSCVLMIRVEFGPDWAQLVKLAVIWNKSRTTHRNHFDGCAKVNALCFFLHHLSYYLFFVFLDFCWSLVCIRD